MNGRGKYYNKVLPLLQMLYYDYSSILIRFRYLPKRSSGADGPFAEINGALAKIFDDRLEDWRHLVLRDFRLMTIITEPTRHHVKITGRFKDGAIRVQDDSVTTATFLDDNQDIKTLTQNIGHLNTESIMVFLVGKNDFCRSYVWSCPQFPQGWKVVPCTLRSMV